MTKEEIIDETVAFYSEDVARRAVRGGLSTMCEYLTDDGRMCAVGRCLLAPTRQVNGTVSEVWGQDRDLNEDLKPEYRGHEVAFWRDLQYLHDYAKHWHSNGLSEAGRDEVARLKEKWA